MALDSIQDNIDFLVEFLGASPEEAERAVIAGIERESFNNFQGAYFKKYAAEMMEVFNQVFNAVAATFELIFLRYSDDNYPPDPILWIGNEHAKTLPDDDPSKRILGMDSRSSDGVTILSGVTNDETDFHVYEKVFHISHEEAEQIIAQRNGRKSLLGDEQVYVDENMEDLVGRFITNPLMIIATLELVFYRFPSGDYPDLMEYLDSLDIDESQIPAPISSPSVLQQANSVLMVLTHYEIPLDEAIAIAGEPSIDDNQKAYMDATVLNMLVMAGNMPDMDYDTANEIMAAGYAIIFYRFPDGDYPPNPAQYLRDLLR